MVEKTAEIVFKKHAAVEFTHAFLTPIEFEHLKCFSPTPLRHPSLFAGKFEVPSNFGVQTTNSKTPPHGMEAEDMQSDVS